MLLHLLSLFLLTANNVLAVEDSSASQSLSPERHNLSTPIVLDLQWLPIDAFNGLYFVDVDVGSPPQRLRLAHDTASGDIFIHSTADDAYLAGCAAQTPHDSNTSSSTYNEVGPGAFSFEFFGLDSEGSYMTDKLTFGGVSIPDQVIGSTWMSELPVGILGTGFRSLQSGARFGTFPEYVTFQERLVTEGLAFSATQSIWLDPSRENPDSFSNGTAVFGALDTSLFHGHLVTVPVSNSLNTSVANIPFNWNVPVSSIRKTFGSHRNFVHDTNGLSCILDTGTAFIALPNATFVKLLAAFPTAVLNDSVVPAIYQVPCSERDNPKNSLTFTFFDPRRPHVNVDIEVPAWQVIWPAHNLALGADPNTCGIAAFAWEYYFGGTSLEHLFNCVIGVNVLKSAYIVYDLGNREASIAPAKQKLGPRRYLRIPAGGVSHVGVGIVPEARKTTA